MRLLTQPNAYALQNGYREGKKKPLIIHLADYSPDFNTPFAQRILKQATKLVCITEEMKSKYEHTLGRKDIEVLHNGAEQECFNIPSPSKIAFSKKNPFRLCFIGSLFSYLHGDCIEDFFSAVQIIREKNHGLNFIYTVKGNQMIF